MMGGNRGLCTLRVPFEHLGARVYQDMYSLAQTHEAFGRPANRGGMSDPASAINA